MHTFLAKPLDKSIILIVDDDQISGALIVNILSKICRCFYVTSAAEATEFCAKQLPDLFVVDVNMPGISGLEFCQQLKVQEETENIPLLFVTGDLHESAQIACWEAGGSDFVTKPVVAQTLKHRVKNQLRSKLRLDALMALSFQDELTGLFNRNYLAQEYPRLVRQLMRDKQPLGLIMFDVDYFKQYNDTYGHMKGDICLENIARVLASYTRRARDAVVRFGGEEFIAILPNTDLAGTKDIAEKMVKSVFELNMTHSGSPYTRVTLSAGALSIKEVERYRLNDLIEQADINLYDAKLRGKNRVVLS